MPTSGYIRRPRLLILSRLRASFGLLDPLTRDEQRFSIMYYRIVRERSWSEIEVEFEFASFFDLRTKDAITSVYYRTRKMWGIDKVLDTDLHFMGDRNRIESEASRFSRDFLADLGYFD
jgi:hypothetical protein